MAKKVRFRLWFHKLNMKRFSNSPSHRKRRNVPSSPPHTLHGFSAPSASNIQACHSFSSPDLNSISATLPSPSHSLPLTFSSPRHMSSSPHGFHATFSVPRHSFPASSPPRHSRKASKPSQNQPIFHTSVRSPINHKGMDIPFPSGSSSPATFLQSPIFQVARAGPAARVSSPQMRMPHSQTVFFPSPLHPLAHHIFTNLSTRAGAMSVSKSPANPSMEARISSRSNRKAEISGISSRIADVSACHSHAQSAEHNLIIPKHRKADQQRPIGASSAKQSPLIVDCGCRPNLSSSFRKTKKTLQACGSCSSEKPGIIPVYDHRIEGGLQMLKGKTNMNFGEESKNSTAPCIRGKLHDTCTLLAKQGHHSPEDSQKKHQLKKRKKKMDVGLSTNPEVQPNQAEFAHTSHLMTSTNEEINRKIKTKKSGFEDADCKQADTKLAASFRLSTSSKDVALVTETCTLAWEKEFSSITSEDTFFSSFERSRPSFSSNSSSECFDKKLSYVCNPAAVSASLGSKEGEHHNLSCKAGDPLVEVKFHGVDINGDKGVAASRKGSTQVASQGTPWINTNHGMKKSCFSSLVEIKEDLCEENNTNMAASGNAHDSRGCKSGLKTLNLQKKLSFDPDYASSSHSDYYANTHTDLQSRSAPRVWRKSDVRNNKGSGDTGSARIRRRAQLQAKWRLHEAQIHWQSSDDSEDEYDNLVSCSSSKVPRRANRRDNVHTQSSTMSRRRKTREIKPKCNNSADSPAAATSKVTSKESENSASCDSNREMLLSNNPTFKCDGVDGEHVHLSKQSSFVTNPRLVDSVAVVKCSKDPLVDFRDSMVDMIIERQLYSAEDLKELLQCFLSLNSHEHYDLILQAFAQVWAKVFHES